MIFVTGMACILGCAGTSAKISDAIASQPTPLAESEAKLKNAMLVADVGFAAPESVLYDERSDVYLVSNVVGAALDRDDQAFISRLRPDGTLEALKWIDSESPEIELDAPKGMTILGDTLYVADIQKVRVFDRVSGKPLRAIEVPQATFLNDIAAATDGSLYVSDSGLTRGFAPTGTDAVFRIDASERVSTLVRGESLGRPNGVLVAEDGVWIATFGTGEMYRVDAQGKRHDVKRLPKGSLDGIVAFNGRTYVSSWEASAIYRCDGDRAEEMFKALDAPADIGIDTRRSRLLVPLFLQNAVVVHQL
jgi:hypothetical protein